MLANTYETVNDLSNLIMVIGAAIVVAGLAWTLIRKAKKRQ
jgi:hypothetical protein